MPAANSSGGLHGNRSSSPNSCGPDDNSAAMARMVKKGHPASMSRIWNLCSVRPEDLRALANVQVAPGERYVSTKGSDGHVGPTDAGQTAALLLEDGWHLAAQSHASETVAAEPTTTESSTKRSVSIRSG
jgi:hypothetical protein